MNYFSFIFFFLGCFSIVGCTSTTEKPQDSSKTVEVKDKPLTEVKNKSILFFGNSLVAAYGLDMEQGFPALIQQKIEALNLEYSVINAGLSGETSAGGLERVDWMLRNEVAIFFLELGANDGLRGLDPASTSKNLQGIIDKVKAKYPKCQIILAGMEAPPNLGSTYTTAFRNVFKALAKKNDLPIVPFLLEGVAGEANLNLADGIHPNEEGQKIVAENVWKILKPLL